MADKKDEVGVAEMEEPSAPDYRTMPPVTP
jgi:hypothetical protein